MAQQQLVDKRDQFVRSPLGPRRHAAARRIRHGRAPRHHKSIGKDRRPRAAAPVGDAVPPSEERRLPTNNSRETASRDAHRNRQVRVRRRRDISGALGNGEDDDPDADARRLGRGIKAARAWSPLRAAPAALRGAGVVLGCGNAEDPRGRPQISETATTGAVRGRLRGLS